MERSYLCTYTMNVPTLRTFTRACSLLKTFSSSKLPSEALQFLPTIVTGNRYRDTYCYRKSLQEIVTETHIVTGNRYRKSLQRHILLQEIVTGNRYRDTYCYRKSLQEIVTETHRYRKSLQEIVTETHFVTGNRYRDTYRYRHFLGIVSRPVTIWDRYRNHYTEIIRYRSKLEK